MLKGKALLVGLCVVFSAGCSGASTAEEGDEGATASAAPVAPALSVGDQVEILNLFALYTHALDSGADDGNVYANVFTPDGVLVDVDGTVHEGRQALARHAAEGSAEKGPTAVSQFLYNMLIEPGPEGAVGKSYVVVTRPGDDGEPLMATDAGQYHDVLVKTPEGWRLKKRTFVKANNYPTTPASLEPIG